MARKAVIVKQRRNLDRLLRAKRAGRSSKHAIRTYNRCNLCGRGKGFLRFFGICRICFRELASNGDIPGVTKSSW